MRTAFALAFLAALPAAAPAQPAASSRWQEIGKTVVGNPVFVDRRSVATRAGVTAATLRVTFVKPVRSPKGEVTSSRTDVLVNCATRQIAVKENWYYHDEKANRVYDHKVVGQPGYSKAFEGSMQAVAVGHLCR
jgi:hypothetical protein